MSMTISVRCEPKQDPDFVTGVLGLFHVRNRAESDRRRREDESPAIVPAWEGQSRTGRESSETHAIRIS